MFKQIDICAENDGDEANEENSFSSDSFSSVLSSELDKDSCWEDDRDGTSHGATNKSEDQLDIGDKDADDERDDNDGDGDDVELAGRDVVGD